MASPRVLVQIVISGSRILGKAFLEAGRQAVKNAKAGPQNALGGDVAGVGNATSGSATDQVTRLHRMTLDEANLILNVKRESSLEQVLKNYEHLFKANNPLPAPEKPVKGKVVLPSHSHYLQSKVFRARERIEAEFKLKNLETPTSTVETPAAQNPSQTVPPPPHELPAGGKNKP